jgi:N-acyl-D-amino-acid deacylase
MTRILLRGGAVVRGAGAAPVEADLLVEHGRIQEIAPRITATAAEVIDCTDRIVLPGLIDMHSHADGRVYDDDVQAALLRQGVTTIVGGQDGVSFAPGDGRHGADYFGGILGPVRHYDGRGVGSLLSAYDGRIRVNVAYLVPLGTVRHLVRGDAAGAATEDEMRAMADIVRTGLDHGAAGVSSGLDYVPGLFADTDELTALAAVAAEAGKVYVSHMRGGYESGIPAGIDEVARIADGSGARVHVSHLHGEPELVQAAMERLNAGGRRGTFDAYPYRRGCTLLGMLILPPELVALGLDDAARRLGEPETVDELLRSWFPQVARRPDIGAGWLDAISYASIPADEFQPLEGLTLAEAGALRGEDPIALACRVLAATRLHTLVVARNPRRRSDDELARVFTTPGFTGGSDGIYLGGRPHPRAWGTFARMLSVFTVQRGDFDWGSAAERLSGLPATVLGLADRGRLRPGAIADIAVVDPATVRDRATYRHPRRTAVGIDDVLVAGVPVLASGELTGALPGGGLRV